LPDEAVLSVLEQRRTDEELRDATSSRWCLLDQGEPTRRHNPAWRSCGARTTAHLRMVDSAWTSPRQSCTTSLPSQSKSSGTSRTKIERRKFEGHAAVLGTCTKYRLNVATRTTDHLDSRLTAVARQVRLPSTNDAQVASMDCASPSDGSEHFKFRVRFLQLRHSKTHLSHKGF
jgi:hypothetical protein